MMFGLDPASQIPSRITASGRTHQRSSLCLHTPETGSSPPTQAPSSTHPRLPTSSQGVRCGHTENRAAPFWETPQTYVLGQGWGQQAWQELALMSPPLPACPSSGTPSGSVLWVC